MWNVDSFFKDLNRRGTIWKQEGDQQEGDWGQEREMDIIKVYYI